MLRAYLDASERQSGVFSVAAVAFGEDRGKKAERDLRRLFGDRRCHMTDLNSRNGAFRGISGEEADHLCRGAVKVITDYASAVVAVSCDVADVKRLAPRTAKPDATILLDVVASPYNCCLHWAMAAMGAVIGRASEQRLQYWFETGDQFQGAARRFVAELHNPVAEPIRRSYCYGSADFVPKQNARLFEAADIVAWEWAKHVERVGAKLPVRRSLAALMGIPCVADNTVRHQSVGRYAMHYTGRPLERFFGKAGAVFQATTVRDVVAAAHSDAWD